MLCAGVTTWSPLRHWKIGPGVTIGVVGLGGLGHMAVKFAHALGAKVLVFTTSPGKCSEAPALGADEAILSTNAEAMAAQKYRFRFMLDTVSSRHHRDPYLLALDMEGTLRCLGIPGPMDFTPVLLTMGGDASAVRVRPARARRRKCWISAASMASRPTSRLSPPRRSTKLSRGSRKARFAIGW